MVVAALALGALAGCGEDDFENEPRPPVPLQLTGVITAERLTVAPNRIGAGPVVITVSNQTEAAHSITLEGEGITERVGPVAPEDTATLQKTLKPGQYVVRSGSDGDAAGIRPATVVVGKPRESSSGELLLP